MAMAAVDSMPPLVEARGASAGYRGAAVVRGADFHVRAGERVSIIGPNGCGKTTLLKAICKLIPLMGGDVLVCGESIAAVRRRELAASISMMAQISEQWFDFTVLDTVLMGRYSRRRGALAPSSGEDRRVAWECLRAVGMAERAGDSITWLSGGQRQRVMLARAFAQEPRVIALDEPTNHLDLKHQAELFEFLKVWASRGGRAVIQVMHDLNLARMYSDRILLMSGGRLVADGAPGDIMGVRALDEAYSFGIRDFMEKSLGLWAANPKNGNPKNENPGNKNNNNSVQGIPGQENPKQENPKQENQREGDPDERAALQKPV